MGRIVSRKLKATAVVLAIIMAATTYIAYNALHGLKDAFENGDIEWDNE